MTTQNLKALLPASYHYHLSKLYKGYYSGYPMVNVDIELLTALVQRLPGEIQQRAIVAQEITWLLEDMHHVLGKLSGWEAAGTLQGNRDAKVFVDALKQYFKDLMVILDEQRQHLGLDA